MAKEIEPTYGGLTIEDIVSRIKGGKQGAMGKFARLDRSACDRFRDPAASIASGSSDLETEEDDEDGSIVETSKIGPSPKLTTSILTKVAAMTIKHPDFRVLLKDGAPEGAEKPVRAMFRRLWRDENWNRVSSKTYMKRCISGMGFASYMWNRDKRKPRFEHVQPWNLSVDPCAQDWQDIEYGAIRHRMSLRKAMKRYPRYSWDKAGNADRTKVKVWVYQDREHECHILEDGWAKLETGPNRYGRFTLLVCEGDIDPGPSTFALGDGILAAGSQQEIDDLQGIISNKAKHGGPINLYDSQRITGEAKNALEDGKEQQWIAVQGLAADVNAVVRVKGEPIEQSEIEALRLATTSQDELLGVNQYMRGVITQGTETATEAALVGSQSGARSSQSKAEYELFLNRWAMRCLFLLREFGGPKAGQDGVPLASQEEVAEWEALKYVDEVMVVEASTLYRDPATDLQQAQTQYQQDVNSFELYMAAAGMGVTFEGVMPNLKFARDRVLRASGIENTEDAWIPVPQQQPAQDDGKGTETLIKAVQALYPHAPPDVRRQIEQQLNLQPSQVGDIPENEGPTENPELEMAKQDDQQQHEVGMQAAQHGHELRMQSMKHQQAAELEQIKQRHAAQIKLAEMSHQSRLTDANNKAAIDREKAKPKPKPGGAKK